MCSIRVAPSSRQELQSCHCHGSAPKPSADWLGSRTRLPNRHRLLLVLDPIPFRPIDITTRHETTRHDATPTTPFHSFAAIDTAKHRPHVLVIEASHSSPSRSPRPRPPCLATSRHSPANRTFTPADADTRARSKDASGSSKVPCALVGAGSRPSPRDRVSCTSEPEASRRGARGRQAVRAAMTGAPASRLMTAMFNDMTRSEASDVPPNADTIYADVKNPNSMHVDVDVVRANPRDSAAQADAFAPAPSNQQAPLQFRTTTIAPSPPPPTDLEPTSHHRRASRNGCGPGTPLRISTDLPGPVNITPSPSAHCDGPNLSPSRALRSKSSSGSLRAECGASSLKSALSNSLGSAGGTQSVIPSPVIAAMGKMTPLPSPLLSSHSPGPWKMLNFAPTSPPGTRTRLRNVGEPSVLITTSGELIEQAAVSASKRRMYANLDSAHGTEAGKCHHPQPPSHGKNRSVSEYVPDHIVPPQRPVAVSGSHADVGTSDGDDLGMRREPNFAASRGLTAAVAQPPTPPGSDSSKDLTDGSKPKDGGFEIFEARTRDDGKLRRWRALRLLGQGTFSRVMLATSQVTPTQEPEPTSPSEDGKVDSRKLVAVKVCEHGPRGGASEERVEMSLKRELEIMLSIRHPSLVNLKAWSIEPTRAILVLSYCPGGDLFDMATSHRDILTPQLMRRMFAELVGAVCYLHERHIVHRDIKLENVLVNLTAAELADPTVDWTTFPHSIVTLADLGLSRRIAHDEKLETRCGSDDYAAPEVIMGQPYDGRATDAWSLGVLLYALLESRLPFDPHPGMSDHHRMRSRTSHRIARVEWRWVDYGGDDGDHEGSVAKFEEQNLVGAMDITEGLLKRARSRWSVEKVASEPWVRDAINIDGGHQFKEEEDGEEVV
ncbi:hypothetical protein RJ55_04565 [Drechmeria coniospora]|nr:hypothetical protein RJ55_04565 [Drechmeria coniospora]